VSASDKPDLARGWQRAETLLEKEADRLATMGDEDFEREMAALPEPSRVPSVDELLQRGAQRAGDGSVGALHGDPVRRAGEAPGKRRRPSGGVSWAWVPWAVAAALLVLVVVVLVLRRPHDEAHPGPLPRERAVQLRKSALEECEAQAWQPCLKELDQAREIDPAGDLEPRVQEARERAVKALRAPDLP
jgi:hypothetical protein